jgi:hypothetical protein
MKAQGLKIIMEVLKVIVMVLYSRLEPGVRGLRSYEAVRQAKTQTISNWSLIPSEYNHIYMDKAVLWQSA